MATPQHTLERVAADLLAPVAAPPTAVQWSRIGAAVAQLHALLAPIAGVSGDLNSHPDGADDGWFAQGMAVSSGLAAQCLTESYRTWRFINGLDAAIREAQRRFPGQTINILYAGCGPYATLLLPLTTRFTPDEIQITLVEANRRSYDAVQRVVDALDRHPYIAACHHADATTYRQPPDRPLHLVVAETMQGALDREPQVAIALHLAPQLAPGGLLVPETITVSACLTRGELEHFGTLVRRRPDGYPVDNRHLFRDRIHLGTLLTLDKSNARRWAPLLHRANAALPPVTLTVPQRPAGVEQFMLLTDVIVFGQHRLSDYDSEVCHPVIYYALDGLVPGTTLRLTYRLGERPRFYVTRKKRHSVTK